MFGTLPWPAMRPTIRSRCRLLMRWLSICYECHGQPNDRRGLSLLIDYGVYLLPGLSLCALWFWLTPKTQPGLRIAILLLSFVLMRDVMTPLGLWSLSGDVQIGFISNPFMVAVLGALSLAIIAALARIAPDLWELVVWRKRNLVVGLILGITVGCAIGIPLRLY